MKKGLLLIFVVLVVSCTSKRENETESSVVAFSKDSAMQSIMYSNLDTINGHWIIKISKDEAIKKGIPEEIYVIFENSAKKINSHIDSIKKRNPNARIGYHFHNMKSE